MLPIVAIALAVALAAWASARTGEVIEQHREEERGEPPAPSEAAPSDAGIAEPSRLAPDGAVIEAPQDTEYACLQPALEVPQEPACARGAPYPRCRWQLPEARDANGLYRVWRNTTPEHRWARPGLVSLVLATAREYAARWPDERLTIGDLDAAGPRHQTHDRGVDVDLYLERSMLDVNAGGGRYVDNYEGRDAHEVELMRARVSDLARILGRCSQGRLRIYYNDPVVVDAFVRWFAAQGLVSDVGPAMMMHNRLHRFHFHMTVAEDLAPLPVEGRGEGRAAAGDR